MGHFMHHDVFNDRSGQQDRLPMEVEPVPLAARAPAVAQILHPHPGRVASIRAEYAWTLCASQGRARSLYQRIRCVRPSGANVLGMTKRPPTSFTAEVDTPGGTNFSR